MVILVSLLLVAAQASSVLAAACSSNLLIDNFSTWSSKTNSLGQYTSDDNSMTSISASGGTLTFTPNGNSYFYETFACQAAATNGYNVVTFTITGPAGGSFTLDIQTQKSCSGTAYTSYSYAVTGLTGSAQTITVPLSSFAGANLNAVTAFLWQDFSKTGVTWEISNVQLGCSGAASSSSSVKQSSSSTKQSTASSPTSVSSSVVATSTSKSASSVSSSASKGTTVSSSANATSASSSSKSSSGSSTEQSSSSSTSKSSSIVASTASSSAASASPSSTGGCQNLLIDDWTSQSRLTFLGYNALLQSSSDDATMKSIVVSANTVTLTPKNTNSYLYSQLGCMNVKNTYGGISLRIKASAGTTFQVQLQAPTACGQDDTQIVALTTSQLGWTFDGTSRLYTIPFSAFSGIDLTKLNTVYFGSLSRAITLGPMELYCGNSGAEYIPPSSSVATGPSSTVPAPAGTASALVIDTFGSNSGNDLGFWHGADDGMKLTWGTRKVTISSPDPDYAFNTQVVGSGCASFGAYAGSYLHIVLSGHTKFSVAFQQHNDGCNDTANPYPGTWDSLEAARYVNAAGTDIWMPISHFNIDLSRVIGFAIKSFWSADAVTFTRMEIVPSIPAGVTIPNKLPSGTMAFGCKRPNSFAFAIDDGDPTLAQQVVDIVKSEGINVTFFTVGLPLEDASTNLSNVYIDMKARGHQIALHSYTHPKMEGLPDYASIDWEYQNDLTAVARTFGPGFHTPYFRPPFGTEGARMRQRLALALGTDNPYLVMWSVDVEDYLWAQSSTPEKQLDAFKRDVNKGGNLVVMHYLYPTTVGYLRQFIQIAKATGKQLMRVDQCMMDPNAPPL